MARLREGHSTWEHVFSTAVSKLIEHGWPLAVWLLAVPLAAVAHHNWPGPLVAAGVGCAGCIAAACVLAFHRGRGRILGAVTVVASGLWLAAADATGISHGLQGIWFVGGGTLAVIWMFHIHGGSGHDFVVKMENAAEAAGAEGLRIRSLILHPRKKTGVMGLQPGKMTPEELARRTQHIEGAAGLPPGALIVSPNIDRADHANYVISDPRLLRSSHAWSGPSAVGASIEEPICPGLWQDGSPVRYEIVNHHVQVMGKTGAGKSMGAGWNEAAETVTRRNTAVFGVDITKGSQFLGALAPALHGLITDPDDIPEFFTSVHECVRPRADYMGERGLTRWQDGCGLSHLTFLLEEAPDIIEALGDDALFEHWQSDVKAVRTAGGRWIISLQRADFTQMPTLARGQLAKWCFGVDSAGDADFGLSALQKDRDCRPELWGDGQPGMAFLDAPGIEDGYKAMPMRCWDWGRTTEKIAAHAAQYPATARPLDEVTAQYLGRWLPQLAAAVPAQPARPSVRLVTAPPPGEDEDMDQWEDELVAGAEITYDPDSPAGQFTVEDDDPPARKLSPEEARQKFRERLAEIAGSGRDRLSVEDVIDLPGQVGRSRPWLYEVLDELEGDGTLRKDTGGRPFEWVIVRAA